MPPLKAYLEAHYPARDAADAAGDVATIQEMRTELQQPGGAASGVGDARRDTGRTGGNGGNGAPGLIEIWY